MGRVACALVLSGIFAARAAWADETVPRVHRIVFEPGNPRHVVLRSDGWGLFRSVDGGATWAYGCPELYGASISQTSRVPMVVAPGGRILVANQGFVGGKGVGLSMSDDFCDWRTSPSLSGHFVEDIVLEGNDVRVLVEDGVEGGIVGRVLQSSDRGETWRPLGKDLPTDFAGTALASAPSDPARLYVLGETVGNTSGTVLEASSDGGATWTRKSGPPLTCGAACVPRFYGVHPTRPDVIFAWVDGIGFDQIGPDGVWVSVDAGTTWRGIYQSTDDLPGFALSGPDATRILVSGPTDGIQGALLDDALADGAAAFSRVFDGRAWALAWSGDGLYAGTDDFAFERQPPNASFSVSHDEGRSFSPIMGVCDVGLPSCPATSTVASTCSAAWNGPRGYRQSYLEGERCTNPPAGDGAVPPQSGANSDASATGVGGGLSSGTRLSGVSGQGGCLCNAAARSNDTAFGTLVTAVGLGVLRRRRRERTTAVATTSPPRASEPH